MTILAERAPLTALPRTAVPPGTAVRPIGPHAGTPQVYVVAGPGAARVAALLGRAGIAASPTPALGADTVWVAAGTGVEEALRAGAGAGRRRLLVVCDTVTPGGLRLAIRAGAAAVLRSADLTPAQLAAAVHGAQHGDGRMPYAALTQLLTGAGTAGPGPEPATAGSPLTARQTAVLDLMAEGHGNAVIARTLRCSEHTVKNVIYELMARLQARNRAHAVAHAVRHGLI